MWYIYFELLVPNFQIARNRAEDIQYQAIRWKNHTDKPVLLSKEKTPLKQGVMLWRLDRTFVNFNESGNNAVKNNDRNHNCVPLCHCASTLNISLSHIWGYHPMPWAHPHDEYRYSEELGKIFTNIYSYINVYSTCCQELIGSLIIGFNDWISIPRRTRWYRY